MKRKTLTGQETLNEALRENLSPQAVATIIAYLQPVRTGKPDVDRQVQWFSELLTNLVGGVENVSELFDEVGL